MSSLTILTKEKLTDCIHLYVDVFNSPPWNETWTVGSAEERLSDLVSTPKFRGYTLHIDGKPAGFIAGNAKRTSKGMTFYIAELCVDPSIQGKGIGSTLLSHLEKELNREGIQSIYLLTSPGSPAEAFYERHSFTRNHARIVMRKEKDRPMKT